MNEKIQEIIDNLYYIRDNANQLENSTKDLRVDLVNNIGDAFCDIKEQVKGLEEEIETML